MELSPELLQAAQSLGKLLNEHPAVAEYLLAKAQVDQDAEAATLESRYDALYNQLVERQDNGEALTHDDLEEYYALGRQLQNHPLIAGRETRFQSVQSLYASVSELMTATLGMEFTDFAR